MNNATQQFTFRFRICFFSLEKEDANAKNVLLTLTHSILIPLIIGANLLLIFGIIKTKKKAIIPSQILFLTLFVSDLTIGVVQLPTQVYLAWKSKGSSCFGVQLGVFSYVFPVSMSFTILFVISMERYLNIVQNKYYKRIVTKQSLTITIIFSILLSITWATMFTLLSTGLERKNLSKRYIAFTVYIGILIPIGVVLNVALLRNVRLKANSPVQQALNSSLTKTIAIIVTTLLITYLPSVITLFAAIYVINNSADKHLFKTIRDVLIWLLILPQINALLNSVIYLARNSRIRHYYYKLFNCESALTPSTILQRQLRPVK